MSKARSLGYRIVEAAARLLSHKRIFCLDAQGLTAYLQKAEKKRKTAPPGFIRKKYSLREELILGRPCYIIMPKNGRAVSAADKNDALIAGKAVLFIHGGGFIMEAHPIHWLAVSKLIDSLGCTVYFPAYPLIPPEKDFKGMAEMVLAVYKKMLGQFPAERIVFLGDSAGAALSLVLCHHSKALREPLPAKLILISPAMLTEEDQGILDAMRRIQSHDVMLAMEFMESMISILKPDMSRNNYFYAPLYGNFTGFPETHVFSGTYEIFYPQIGPFVERLKAAKVPVQFYTGREMMHVWPYIPLARSCTSALAPRIRSVGQA